MTVAGTAATGAPSTTAVFVTFPNGTYCKENNNRDNGANNPGCHEHTLLSLKENFVKLLF